MRRFVLAAAVVGLLLIPTPAMAASAPPKPDRGWVCDLSGSIVAAGIGAATAGITGILAGGAFTAGCHLGATRNATLISGLPRNRNCWLEWHKRRFKLRHWHPPMSLRSIRYYSVRVCRV